VGNHSVFAYQRALTPQGTCIITGFGGMVRLITQMILGPLVSKKDGKKVAFQGIATTAKSDLAALKELLEAVKIVPVIDRCYPLSENAAAIRYLEKGHAQGKVVISAE
jgi:NADPH:quinone reductase-like Zn-dependent oxidoreductase